jgi:hypothetical protein
VDLAGDEAVTPSPLLLPSFPLDDWLQVIMKSFRADIGAFYRGRGPSKIDATLAQNLVLDFVLDFLGFRDPS